VKTVNPSDENVGYLYWNSYNQEMTVLDVQTTLPDGLKRKLKALCKDTVEKFEAYDNRDTNCLPSREIIREQLNL